MTDDKDDRKITWRFRLWFYRHRGHLVMRPAFGNAYCAKCLIPAPEVFK